MKKDFETPEVETVEFETEEILSVSNVVIETLRPGDQP